MYSMCTLTRGNTALRVGDTRRTPHAVRALGAWTWEPGCTKAFSTHRAASPSGCTRDFWTVRVATWSMAVTYGAGIKRPLAGNGYLAQLRKASMALHTREQMSGNGNQPKAPPQVRTTHRAAAIACPGLWCASLHSAPLTCHKTWPGTTLAAVHLSLLCNCMCRSDSDRSRPCWATCGICKSASSSSTASRVSSPRAPMTPNVRPAPTHRRMTLHCATCCAALRLGIAVRASRAR
jgi:hypothetical protein